MRRVAWGSRPGSQGRPRADTDGLWCAVNRALQCPVGTVSVHSLLVNKMVFSAFSMG